MVHNKSATEGSQKELSEDLLAVCKFFVARNNGKRGGRGKQRKRHKVEEDQVGPDHRVERVVAEVGGDGEVDIQPLPSPLEHEQVQDEQDRRQTEGRPWLEPR